MPDLAVLGKQRRIARGVATDGRELPRNESRRVDFGGGNRPPGESHQGVAVNLNINDHYLNQQNQDRQE